MRYVFHTHERVPSWRMVTLEGAALPEGCRGADWRVSRVREHDDTSADARREIQERGYSLFKLGGSLAEVERDLCALQNAREPAQSAMSLARYPVHLGLGATANSEPEFGGAVWHAAYGLRHAKDGREARLVSLFRFETSWDSWEVHPFGSEVVLCTAGEMTLIQEIDGAHVRTRLLSGEYAINQPGTWHTADIAQPATAVFVTAGSGTQHRPR